MYFLLFSTIFFYVFDVIDELNQFYGIYKTWSWVTGTLTFILLEYIYESHNLKYSLVSGSYSSVETTPRDFSPKLSVASSSIGEPKLRLEFKPSVCTDCIVSQEIIHHNDMALRGEAKFEMHKSETNLYKNVRRKFGHYQH